MDISRTLDELKHTKVDPRALERLKECAEAISPSQLTAFRYCGTYYNFSFSKLSRMLTRLLKQVGIRYESRDFAADFEIYDRNYTEPGPTAGGGPDDEQADWQAKLWEGRPWKEK